MSDIKIVQVLTYTAEAPDLTFKKAIPGVPWTCDLSPFGDVVSCNSRRDCRRALAFYSSSPTYIPLQHSGGQFGSGKSKIGWLDTETEGLAVIVWCSNFIGGVFQMALRETAPTLSLPNRYRGGPVSVKKMSPSRAFYDLGSNLTPPRVMLYQEADDIVPSLKSLARFTRGEYRLVLEDAGEVPACLAGVNYFQPIFTSKWTESLEFQTKSV